MSGKASQQNLLAKEYIRSRYSDIAGSSSALYCIKMQCFGVCELCLGVSGWGLGVSGDEFMQNVLAQVYVGHVSSDIAFYFSGTGPQWTSAC